MQKPYTPWLGSQNRSPTESADLCMNCFILSPFQDPFDEYYQEIISPVIRGLGVNVMRADEIYGVRPIMDDIVQGIIDADVIIADVTTRNPNVNYELGMAHALGKPVVIISQSVEDIPFDYRHVRVIIYDTKGAKWTAKLKKKLRATVKEIVAGKRRVFLHEALAEFYRSSGQTGEWGLVAVYSARQEMNIRSNSLYADMRTRLDISAFGLKSFRDAKTTEIRTKVKNGLRLRILTMHPDYQFLAQRELDEKVVPGEIKKRILDLATWMKDIQSVSPSPANVALKFYDALPLDFYWHQERWLFVGPYLHGRGSQQAITFEFSEGGRAYDYYTTYFEELWEDENFGESVLG